jgi:hypothetical protein
LARERRHDDAVRQRDVTNLQRIEKSRHMSSPLAEGARPEPKKNCLMKEARRCE